LEKWELSASHFEVAIMWEELSKVILTIKFIYVEPHAIWPPVKVTAYSNVNK